MTAANEDKAEPESGRPSGGDALPACRAHLLGSFALFDAQGRNVTPNRRKARALLAYLALQNGSATREQLSGLLWGARADEQARASLRQTLYELRSLSSGSGALVGGDREDIALAPGALATDVTDIEQLAGAGNFEKLSVAVARWSGPLLADLDGVDDGFDEWLGPARERTHTRLIDAILSAADRHPADSRTIHAIGTQLQTIDPLNEQILRLLMRADAKAGDVASAHRRFNRFAERLSEEVQAKPSQETRHLLRDLTGASQSDVREPSTSSPAPRTDGGGAIPSPREFKAVKRPAAWFAAGVTVIALLVAGTLFLRGGGTVSKVEPFDQSTATDPMTLELYKRARDAMLQRTSVDNRSAVALLSEVVSRAPRFSRAWSTLAFVQLGLASEGAADSFEKETAALSSARKALELDPANAEAYLTLAWQANTSGESAEAFEYLEKGLAIEPRNTDLARTRGQFLLLSGRTADAIIDLERACILDPLDPRAVSLLVTALRGTGRNTEAALMLEHGLKRFPNYRHLVNIQTKLLILDGRYDEAERMLVSDRPLPTSWIQELAQNRLPLIRALRSQRRFDADALVAQLLRKGRANDFGNEAVWQLAVLRRYADAYDLLKSNYSRTYSGGGRSLPDHEAKRRDWMVYNAEDFTDAALSAFRRDAAFLYLFDDGKMLDYWLAANKWPDFCADSTLPYSCKAEALRHISPR